MSIARRLRRDARRKKEAQPRGVIALPEPTIICRRCRKVWTKDHPFGPAGSCICVHPIPQRVQ